MRISVVPAQITTIEDKIVGNVTLIQAMLIGAPILLIFIIVLVLPPSGQFVIYKLIISSILFCAFGSSAIRIQDRIVLHWLKLFFIYNTRPLRYVYNKNSTFLRKIEMVNVIAEEVTTTPQIKKTIADTTPISHKEFVRLREFATDQSTGIKFKIGKKGKLNVHITEIK